MQDLSSYNQGDRQRALVALRTLSLDDCNKVQLWENHKQRTILLKSAAITEPSSSIRIEALHTLKNIAFSCEVNMFDSVNPIITDAVLDPHPQIVALGVGLLYNLSLHKHNQIVMYEQHCWTLANIVTEHTQCTAYKTLRRLTEHPDNRHRYYTQRQMQMRLYAAASFEQPNSIREHAFAIIANLASDPTLAESMWIKLSGVKDLILQATEDLNVGERRVAMARNSIAVRQHAFRAMSNLAACTHNSLLMFDNATVIARLIQGAGTRQAQSVRRFALQTIKNLSSHLEVARQMWHTHPVLVNILCAGGKLTVVNFIRVEAMAAIANLAEQEDNRQSMWLNRNCREAILAAVEVVATAASNVDTTPPIEKAGLRALELLTGVDMCR